MWKSRLFNLAVLGGVGLLLSFNTAQPSQALDVDLSDPEEVTTLVEGNNEFALRLYSAIADDSDGGNVFFSPYSVSQALAMVYAGADGVTAEQMAEVLGFTLDDPALNIAFFTLNADLIARGNSEANDDLGLAERQLHIANALWGEQTFPFSSTFLDRISQYYGGGFNLTDYINNSEEARETINQWVADNTADRIQNIIPAGVLDPATRLVLANAIYFKNAWSSEFGEYNTASEDFYLLDGSTITADLMNQTAFLRYAEGEGYQVVNLPYQQAGMSMLVILPDEGAFADFEGGLSAEQLDEIITSLNPERVNLTFPKFEFEQSVGLSNILRNLGMTDAFTGNADFSGMIDPDGETNESLMISDVLHKAFIAVDEDGTEAAAATAVIMSITSVNPMEQPEPIEMRVDRPFIFAIRDDVTGTLLFIGRVVNPAD